MTSPSWRKTILLNRSALLSAWPRHFPRHDFVTLRYMIPRDLKILIEEAWDAPSWKQAALDYHEEHRSRMRQRRW